MALAGAAFWYPVGAESPVDKTQKVLLNTGGQRIAVGTTSGSPVLPRNAPAPLSESGTGICVCWAWGRGTKVGLQMGVPETVYSCGCH